MSTPANCPGAPHTTRNLALLLLAGTLLAASSLWLSGCAGFIDEKKKISISSLTISNPGSMNVTMTSAAVDWQTNVPATSQVEFGTTTAYGSTTALDSTMVTSHQQGLSSLKPGTLYHYRVHSTDAYNNSVATNDLSLTTTAAVAPTITTQPGNQTVAAGQTASFTVVAAGTAPLSYQWQRNGASIAGATAASYTTPATTTADSGSSFAVVVSNTAGTVTSSAALLTVNAAAVAPTITTQPGNQTVVAGQTASFTVVAAGTAPLGYQWQKNGASIAGATAASYTTPAATTADSGATFRVVVSNTAGIVTSSAATLTVNAAAVAPTITTQPVNQTVTAGLTATFTVVASGTTPLSYQWQKNGLNISSATASSYTTPATTTSDSGSTFAVVISNSAGTVTSSAATLTVNANTTAPTAPTGLVATASTCGQVDLSWGASTDSGGSGLKAYVINRSDGVNTVIGAARTTFSDTNWVRSSTTLTYYVLAQDNAGNNSQPSNQVAVVTPTCPMSSGEQIVDSAYIEPLGKSMATYGTLTAVIYQKLNTFSTRDTWLYVNDSNTGQTSRFLLHSSPGYLQIETDYVLTSATELWTLSCDANSGKLLVSQYQLNGSPPTSATPISTQSLGDTYSYAMSMIRLQSGALAVSWSDQSWTYTGDLIAGYAYRSSSGTWIVHPPVTLASSGGVNQGWKTRMILAQHPADGSVWMFTKEDTSSAIEALHFSEAAGDFVFNWVNATYITQAADGDNGPETEFPFLAAAPDPTRNAILLAYQSRQYQFVFIDALYGSSNSIFLKQAYATIAQINADGSKTFIPFQTYMERASQFGMSVLSDGTIWLAYLPINSQSLTWNEVYASKYQSGAWSAPVLTGLDYSNYNQSSGLGSALIYRTDQPLVAFQTPDQKIHTFALP